MRTIAVVCEYNPFHKGHQYLIQQARARFKGEETRILCLMSGSFVQRGEPAVFDKYKRARMAIKGGADLVLELPAPYSCSVAEHFAAGAISIIHRLGIADVLAFGSEGKKEDVLALIAARLSSSDFLKAKEELRLKKRTLSYPKLIDLAYATLYGEALALSSNEILGVQYLTALKKEQSGICPIALPMLSGVCASVIRKELIEQNQERDLACLENGTRAILTYLSVCGKKNRFSENAPYCKSLEELFARVRTANDTDARLKRELLFLLFGQPEESAKIPPSFTVLLGANEKGRELLCEIEKKSTIPVLSKLSAGAKTVGDEVMDAYLRRERLYALFTEEAHNANFLFEKRPYIQ